MTEEKATNYYVDEAGDLTFFDKRGRIIVGKPGVSQLFMVGVAHLPQPKQAAIKLQLLRQYLLADPYFKDVPSMKPESKKTSLCFHAKNDLPEVRREVFKLLPTLQPKVQVAIRRKQDLAHTAKQSFKQFKRKMNINAIYDDLVKRLFKNLLHKADENHIICAVRGDSARQQALEEAIQKAQKNFHKKWNISVNNKILIRTAYPPESPGLQVIDYYLWALQRMLERGEDRFFQLLAPGFRLIMDLDDTRNNHYGQWYSDKNPISLQKIKPIAG